MKQFKLYRWEDGKWLLWLLSNTTTWLVDVAEDKRNKHLKMKIENPEGKVIYPCL